MIDAAEALNHHWALDSIAAQELGPDIESSGFADRLEDVYGPLDIEAVRKRDEYRERIAKIFRGESDEKLIIIGPCSFRFRYRLFRVVFIYKAIATRESQSLNCI